jgi:hypothetical protein
VVATPEPKIVYGIAYRPQGRRTGEALLLWRQLRECLLYLPTNNEIGRSASPIAFVFQILQE